jgi:hypothetical protein
METSHLPVEDVAVRSVLAAKYDKKGLAGFTRDPQSSLVVCQPNRLVRRFGLNISFREELTQLTSGDEKNESSQHSSHPVNLNRTKGGNIFLRS